MPPTDEQVINELRALRPTAREEFSAELDARAAAGFPRSAGGDEPPPRRRNRLERFAPRRPTLAIAAGIAAATIGIAVVAESVREDRGQDLGPRSDGGGGGALSAPSESAAPAGDAAVEPAPTTVPPVPGRARKGLKPGEERVQERSASMTLSTEPGEVDDVADGVVEVTERHEGIVVSSDLSTAAERSRASFDLRIPTANLQTALADLSDLASVSARSEGTLDITAPFVTAEERFRDAKAEVDALLEELAETDSESEIASIRERLELARGELGVARSELRALKQRAAFSRVSLVVVGDGDADGWSLGDAVDDAVSVLEDLAGAALVALAVIVPLGALALAAWYAFGALRRRRRERALDE